MPFPRMTVRAARHLIPPLADGHYKGQHGRVGVVGGSLEYTGAPYYAGAASLSSGSELVFMFCSEEASSSIKTYSPEMMVLPAIQISGMQFEDNSDTIEWARGEAAARDKIADFIPRLSTMVIGPGLGRAPAMLGFAKGAIRMAREAGLPVILDADALWLAHLDPVGVFGPV